MREQRPEQQQQRPPTLQLAPGRHATAQTCRTRVMLQWLVQLMLQTLMVLQLRLLMR